ncbi:MAG: anaerobic ribonucleoside-triphosphate reductase activating protein [Candidatus Micrarchaeota archaeon]
MLIKGLQPLSLIDYPGRLSAIIFLFGCNFRCPFCHNPGLVDASRENLREVSESEVLAFLDKRKGKLEGVVVTGGEPCLNNDLPELLHEIKQRGFLVKLDSNGTNPEMLKQLAASGLVDYFAMDVKAPLEKYGQVVNASVDTGKIRESIDFIKASGIEHEFRTTVVPTLLNEDDLLEMGKLIEGAGAYYLQQFEPGKTLDPEMQKAQQYAREFFTHAVEKLKPFAKKVEVRGL